MSKTKEMTPLSRAIENMKSYKAEYERCATLHPENRSLSRDYQLQAEELGLQIVMLTALLPAEKEFAKSAFDAGQDYQTGEPEQGQFANVNMNDDFDTFYSKHEV